MPATTEKLSAGQLRRRAAAELRTAIKEATENHQYWLRQAVIRTHPEAIAHAKSLRDAWKTTLAAHESRLAAL
jgi:hypothetical protein